MPMQFDNDMKSLNERVLTMGVTAQRMIANCRQALVDWDKDLLTSVVEDETAMDKFQREIDEEAVRLISVYTPVASDLRMLLVVSRVNAELERIGDQCMNIAFYGKQMMKEPPLKPRVDIPRMAELVSVMVRDALDAFIGKSSETAVKVIARDDIVDDINDQVFRVLMTYVLADPKTIPQAMEFILTARAMERIGDHAVSICEDVVYMVEGHDIRHLK